jgi:integrase/recombinase XerD
MAGQATILSSKEIEQVFKLLKPGRDRCLFGLGVYTGMRIGEIIRLRQDQVFTPDGGIKYQLTVKRLKKRANVYSDIPVHPKLRQLLKEYKSTVRKSEWLFPSSESIHGHLSRIRAHLILAEAFDALKLQGASTHSMRRTCLTQMSRAGIPLRTIQEISGHSNLGQLQSYLQVDPEDKHRAINLLKY